MLRLDWCFHSQHFNASPRLTPTVAFQTAYILSSSDCNARRRKRTSQSAIRSKTAQITTNLLKIKGNLENDEARVDRVDAPREKISDSQISCTARDRSRARPSRR